MKHSTSIRLGLLCGLLVTELFATSGPPTPTNVWSGLGPTGWQNGLTPPFDGSDVLYLGDAVNTIVPIPTGASIYALLLGSSGQDYFITSGTGCPVTLNLSGGIGSVGSFSSNNVGYLYFDPSITLNLSGSPTISVGASSFYLPGVITGDVGSLLLTNGGGPGGLIFNGDSGNTYAGNTVIYSPSSPSFSFSLMSVAIWNCTPFSTGDVTIVNGANLVAHNTLNLPNALLLANDGSTSYTTLSLRSWDGPLTFSGAVTLASDAWLQTHRDPSHVSAYGNEGVYATPGTGARNPIIFSGGIGETEGSSHSLMITGGAPVILTGSSTYTGSTTVGMNGGPGSLIFGNFGAIPIGNITVNTGGYAGIAGEALNYDYTFAVFLSKLTTVDGAVGVDSPAGTPFTLTDNIDLTGANFSSSARLGTASEDVTLSGTITPNGQDYQFGNGGGNLTVASSLSNLYDSTSSLILDSHGGPPLRLILTGDNNYGGGTTAVNGFIVFAGSYSMPGGGLLTAGGESNFTGGSYIGYTVDVWGGELSPSSFLSRFDKANTWGIIGFDTTNPAAPFNYGSGYAINLSGFNDGVFLGTSTAAILSGMIRPSDVTNPNYEVSPNPNYAPNTLRFTAARGGVLTIETALTDSLTSTESPLGVVYGTPNPEPSYSNGTIILNGANSYTGGTWINSNGPLTLEAGSNAAFGDVSSAITLAAGNGGPIGLQAGTKGLMIPNNIFFQPNGENDNTATLAFTGWNDFALSGSISGMGTINLIRDPMAKGSFAVTLLGGSPSYQGDIYIQNSTLVVGSNYAAGQGTMHFLDPNAALEFTTAYTDLVNAAGMGNTAPVLYGIEGHAGKIVLPDGINLTFDLSHAQGTEFGGTITGPDGNPTSASLTIAAAEYLPAPPGTAAASSNSNSQILYLYGVNNYTGGTTIIGNGALGLGNAASAGTGPITINASNGGLAVNQGVVLNNSLVFLSGGLAGAGTFAPMSVNNVEGGTLVFGSNRVVFPGIPGGSNALPGQLTLISNVEFANGGGFEWTLQDVTRADGFSTLLIQGNLALTADPGGFEFKLHGTDNTGSSSVPVGFDANAAYSWIVLTTTGTITGFNPAAFTIDASGLDNGLLADSHFSLSLEGQSLLLNYSAVPEPSTWALLLLGLGALGLAAARRRTGNS